MSKEIGRAAPGEAREQAKAASTALKEKIAADFRAAAQGVEQLIAKDLGGADNERRI
jgi:hypothetical protein